MDVKCFGLIAILVGAMFVASAWMIRVPFMQETDEQAHADYAYEFFDVGGFFVASQGIPRDRVTPEVRFLAQHSNFKQLRRDLGARVPAGYGTASYFRQLDAEAPRPSDRPPAPGAKIPFVAYQYPIGYYVLTSSAMAVAYFFSHGSIVATYFAARFLGVVLLGITLFAAFDIFRSSRLSYAISLALTAAFGFMPLTSWVSAYIQPDTLTNACAMVFLALLIRWRARPFDTALTAWLCVVLCVLCFVKHHYALVLAFACGVTMLACAIRILPSKRALAVAFASCVAVPAAAFFVATHWTPVGTLEVPGVFARSAHDAGIVAWLAADARYAASGLYKIFIFGGPFLTYWLYFADLPTSFVSDHAFRIALENIFGLCSIAVISLVAYRQLSVFAKLPRLLRRHVRTSVALVFGDPVLNVYIAWTSLLLAVLAQSRGSVYLEGRYFLPMTVPAMLLCARYVPRIFPRAKRTYVCVVAATMWLAATATMAPLAYAAMEQRFYGPLAAPGAPPFRDENRGRM